jgi:hypothetical protein
MQNDMRDRLVKLLGNRCCSKQIPCEICEYQNFGDCHKYALAEHLIANGVIVPPCKVGQTVYSFAYPRTDIIVIDEETVEDCHFIVETDECYYDERDIGRTVFLTKEQAEQKLKELRENGKL